MTAPITAELPANTPPSTRERLLPAVLMLAGPVVVEQLLHSFVGLTDSYLANNLTVLTDLVGEERSQAAATNASAAAAVGTIAYVLWFVGLISSTVGTGATALISRAVGAKNRRVANSVCGQAVISAVVLGSLLGLFLLILKSDVAPLTGLSADAQPYFDRYVSIVAYAMPLAVLMFAAGACLRGAGDTLTPAIAMMSVDVVNAVLSFALVRGWFGLPKLGFDGIAIGTAVAYACGATMLLAWLVIGRGTLRLFLHRLRPNVATLRRMFRIGLPGGLESTLMWLANFAVLFMVNRLGDLAGAAHLNAIRIEAFSYLPGFAFAVAASTLVGQSLGRRDPHRARRCTYLAYALAAGVMSVLGLVFILFGTTLARQMSDDPAVVELTATALFYTGFCQAGFAGQMVFGFAMRGAGDTMKVMQLTLSTLVVVRLGGALIVTNVLGLGLGAVWIVLATDQFVRGVAMYLRFRGGKWETAKV